MYLENGSPSTDATRPLADDADPVLVYAMFAWLRAYYHPGHSASDGVLGRIVALCTASPAVARAARSAEKDPIVEWLEESFTWRDLDRDELVSLVVDKLEG